MIRNEKIKSRRAPDTTFTLTSPPKDCEGSVFDFDEWRGAS